MSKWVIDTVELIKRQYVVDAYSRDEAIGKMKDQAPHNIEVLSDTIFDIHSINEYEYEKEWSRPDRSLEFLDPDIGPDQLKDNLDWIDKASGRDREGNGK